MKPFNSKDHTDAPQQLQFSKMLKSSIDEAWDILSMHEAISKWIPMVNACIRKTPGPDGNWEEGCVREVLFGKDTLTETIVHWDEPYGYAYSISDMHVVKDHVGHFELTKEVDGTRITWTQYYKPQGNFVKRWLAKNVMLPSVMKKALKNFEKSLRTLKNTP